jgi:GTPase
MFERPRSGERAILVRLGFDGPIDPEDLQEFWQLAISAGAEPIATLTGRRERPDPHYFMGSGKADELRLLAQSENAEVILVDHSLSPRQERNLEKLTQRRVLDRSGLILDIFAQRARSFEGKLEVELAQLKHIATRLRGGWAHLERQKGGIGLRGPGETQLEIDKRLLADRVRLLTKRLGKIQQQRDTGRQQRAEIPVPLVTLVGYTNAGKSTLFRALTGSDAFVADQLFATLDPTVRRIQLPGGSDVVVADTVGFIRELPHELVNAFQSTLTEAREAMLLLHVVDAADPRRSEHIAQVDAVLAQIGADHIPQILLYNKIDRLAAVPRVERNEAGNVQAVWISAEQGLGFAELRDAIAERLGLRARAARVRLPVSAGALRSRLYQSGVVTAERLIDGTQIELDVALPDIELTKLARAPGVQIT